PVHEGAHTDPGCRRLGARVLPEVPEPSPGLPRGLVEHGQLGRGREALRGSKEVTQARCRHEALSRGPALDGVSARARDGMNRAPAGPPKLRITSSASSPTSQSTSTRPAALSGAAAARMTE